MIFLFLTMMNMFTNFCSNQTTISRFGPIKVKSNTKIKPVGDVISPATSNLKRGLMVTVLER